MIRKLILLGAIVSASAAWAYVPPTWFLVRSIAAKHAGFRTLRLKSVVTQYDGDKPGSVHFQQTTEINFGAGTVLLTALDDAGQRLYVTERKLKDLRPSSAVLFESQSALLAESLASAGIAIHSTPADKAPPAEDAPAPNASASPGVTAFPPLSEALLKRWKGGIAWVIPSAGVQQFWIEKDTFYPIRLVTERGEFHFEQTRLYKEFPFPKLTSFVPGEHPDGHPAFSEETRDLQLNVDLKQGSKADATPGWTAAGNFVSGSVKEFIERYYDFAR